MWPEVEVRNLFLAVHSQHEEEVERALSEGSLANSQDAQGIGALYYAASGTSSKIVSLLLNHGADVNAKGHSGQTPLHRAASNATITHLLLAAGADVNARDVCGNTPAHLAVPFSTAEMEETSALHVLVDHEPTLNTRNYLGITPFHLILEEHELDLNFFLERGASATLCFPDGRTPLDVLLSKLGDFETWAVQSWADIVRLMIEKGADPCSLLPTGKPLVLAYIESLPKMGHSFREDMPLGRALCKHADFNLPMSIGVEPQDTLLHALSRNCGANDGSKLQFGCLFDNVLRRGADPNVRDKSGRTPLLLLLMSQRNNRKAAFDSAKILVSHGANPWISDWEGNSAISVAKEPPRYSDACLHYLLRASLKSQIGMISKCDRRSILHYCTFREWIEAVDADDWTESTRCISAAGTSFRPEGLKTCMLKVLAEWYLETSVERTEGVSAGMEQRRRYNAQIIRDCHVFGIRLDLDYYDYLLQLCL
ncbi:hypothetical protein CCHR01_18436 [Colletotrichum chrysophilum]|uniref:Ankyrin repeat protein n=1 Tax=Colletotrichum chrysophilum TaxID=1836956 RepID=A0AAD9A0J4_9PEZI|nr:hypothetical protein CCHR01_18436 [Colletotrichum chrysophilum]